MSPLFKSYKDSKIKDLQKQQSSTVAPAYKQNPKNAENELESLPAELADIVAVWNELPEHIKAAIISLVGTCK